MTFDTLMPEPPVVCDDPRKAAILHHARRAFMTSNYAATRIEPIARDAGVSTATVYAYFPSKDALFAAVIIDASADFQGRMEKVRAASGSAKEQLTGFLTGYAGFVAEPFVRSAIRLVMTEGPRFREVALRFFERGRRIFGGPLMDALVAMDASGELRVAKPSWAAGQLMGMVEHPLFVMPLVTGEELSPARSVEQIVEDAVETFMARYAVPSPTDQG